MALTLNPEAQTVFFATLFGPNHDVTQKVKALIAQNVAFETAVYTVKATHKGNSYTVNLTKGTTSLMKHEVDFAVAEQNKNLIKDFILNVAAKVGLAPSVVQPLDGPVSLMLTAKPGGGSKPANKLVLIKAVMTVTGQPLGEAKKFVESVFVTGESQSIKTFVNALSAQASMKVMMDAGADVLLVPDKGPLYTTMYPPKPSMKVEVEAIKVKPTNTIMHLKDAKALGQKVHGTSSGSVYHCIAVSEHVKVAARLYKSGGISIRTEWTDNPQAELAALKDAGVQMKGGYGSIHFDAGDVPMPRVIGAFLMGTGIAWKQVVTSGADLVIGEK